MLPAGFSILSASAIIPQFTMDWKNCPSIPPRSGMTTQFGLAGPLSGAHGNYLLVAGGANFENGMPWRGGAKTYHDDVYLLDESKGGKLSWQVPETKLPFPVAYSACVTTDNGFVSMGGENENGPVSKVFHFKFSDGSLKTEFLPDLPVAVTSAGATLIGDKIYIAGGLDKNGATRGFYSLNLSQVSAGWMKIPDLPVKLSHAVVVAQKADHETAVFVIGGRNKTSDVSDFFSSVYKYSFRDNKWTKVSDIKIGGEIVRLSAGTGFARGKDQIVLFGGDRGIFFNQTERMNLSIDAEKDPARKDSLMKQKDYFLTNHPGFSKQLLVYNTITGKWTDIGTIPYESPATTVTFKWNGKQVVPSGEIRPGVRTDRVIMFEMKD